MEITAPEVLKCQASPKRPTTIWDIWEVTTKFSGLYIPKNTFATRKSL